VGLDSLQAIGCRPAIGLLMLLSGCVTNAFERAPIEACHPWGVVRGYTSADVEQVSSFAEELAPRIESWMQPAESSPLRIVVVPQSPDQPAPASTPEVISLWTSRVLDRYIIIAIDAAGPRRFLLAHELVHWYAVGVWKHLPMTVEEGLADVLASRIEPELGVLHALMIGHRGDPRPEDYREMLALERGEEGRLDFKRKDMLYLVGNRIAERCGVRGLRAWCEEVERTGDASVLASWIEEN
jgi:hypothetical protein